VIRPAQRLRGNECRCSQGITRASDKWRSAQKPMHQRRLVDECRGDAMSLQLPD
jgi:hypothetical protein